MSVPDDREHDFTLVLAGPAELTAEVEDALFEAGCDDATPSVRGGRHYLHFTRAGGTREDAIADAILDVMRAGREVVGLEGGDDADGGAALARARAARSRAD